MFRMMKQTEPPPQHKIDLQNGYAYLSEGEYLKAAECYTRVLLRTTPNYDKYDIQAFYYRGLAYLLNNKSEWLPKAYSDFAKTIKLTITRGGQDEHILARIFSAWIYVIIWDEKF